MATKTALERIAEIQANAAAEVEKLKGDALSALNEEKKGLLDLVKKIDKQIEELTGKAPKAGKRASSGSSKADFADAKELKAVLNKADGKKLNRKGFNDAGYSLKSAIAIAKADKATFGFEQNAAQGSVWIK
jgi:hypothetical protein